MQDEVAPAQAPAAGIGVDTSWGAELRATFALAWPLVIAQLAQTALTVTDVIMMGWLGPESLAAGSLASSFLMPILLFGIGLVGAVAPLTSQARGARDIKAVRRIVRQGFWASLVLSAVLIPIVLQLRNIFGWLGQDPTLAVRGEEYVQVAVMMFPAALGIIVLRSLLSSFDSTRVILVVTVGGVLVNALLNYGLIFGNFGLPRLELRGAALATVLTNCVMFGALLAFVLRHRKLKRFHILMRFWKPDWVRFRQIFRIGTPIGLTVLAEVGLFTAAALLMGRISTDAVAAHAVALQFASTAFMVPLGLGIAATVRVGFAYGRRDRDGIHKAGWTAFVLGTGFMALSCLIFLVFAPSLVGIFLDPRVPENGPALTLAAGFLAVAGVFQLVDGAQVVAAHALRGLNDTTVPMIVAFVGYWLVGLPVAWGLGFGLGWGGQGVWLGLAAGLAFVAAVLVTRFALREKLGLVAWIDQPGT